MRPKLVIKILAALTTFMFAISINAGVAIAAQKITAGATCKTLNQKINYQGKTYTCQKKASKLIWSKGVLTKSSAKSQPTLAPKTQTPLQKLYTDIYQRYQNASKETSPTFNFVRCPDVDRGMALTTEKAYIDAYTFWAPIYKATAKVNWLLMSENDWDCWYKTTVEFEGPNSPSRQWKTWDKDSGVMGHCYVSARAFCGYGTGTLSNGLFAQYNLIGSSYKSAPTPMTVHHETVHIYQMQLMADNYQTSKSNTLACWFNEGQANLFGFAIAFKGDPTDRRQFEKNRLLQVYPTGATYSKDEWINVLNNLKTQGDFCFKNELGYTLGWFVLEWTYMNYTIEEMHNFLELIAKGSTWEQAIQTIMKMDEQTYFSKVAQYLADEI